MNQSCERERLISKSISQSFKRENFTSKSSSQSSERENFTSKSTGQSSKPENFTSKSISQSFERGKFINLKIDRSKFELLGEEIRQMATTNSPKMKQRTFYNVFENGPRVAGANATAANFKVSDGFPTSFEVCQPCGRRMLNRAKGKQLTRKRCRPIENLQILWTATGVTASTFILAEC